MNLLFNKQFLILLILGFSFQYLAAQTEIPNGSFENWDAVGNTEEEPVNWSSNETGGGVASWGPQTCSRTTDAFAGSYAVRLETKSTFGNAVNGTVTTGKIEAPSINPSDGYIHTVRSDANFNSPFTGRPDSLVGYFKYQSVNGDQAKILAVLHGDYDVENPDQGGSAPFVIGQAEFFTPNTTIGAWTRFSVPFTYVNNNTPSYILSIVTSSAGQGSAQEGSVFLVDELEAIYNPAEVSSLAVATGNNYDVSDAQGANISVNFTASGPFGGGNTFTAQLSDANGSFSSPIDLGTTTGNSSGTINGFIPAYTPNGNSYRVRIVADDPNTVSETNGSDITINLCINTSETITETACTSYTSANGNVYANSGTFTETSPVGNICQHTITLDLTIIPVDINVSESNDVLTAAATNATFQWLDCNNNNMPVQGETGATFAPSVPGQYAVAVTQNGCSEISACYNVNFCVESTSTITEAACGSYTSPSGMVIIESGQYTDIIPNATNCDSIITINLTVTQVEIGVSLNGETLTADATAGMFQWVDCDSGLDIDGATSASFSPTVTGSYAVVVTQNNCTEASACTNVFVCVETSASITEFACDTYTSPSGVVYTDSGIYTDVIPNANNCDSTITIDLTVTVVETAIAPSGNILTAIGQNATYQWVDCDNNNAPIAGATSQSFVAEATGNYAVIVTQYGCSEQSDCYNVVISAIDPIFQQSISLTPNPSNDWVNLTMNVTYPQLSISVININGQMVLEQNIKQKQNVRLNVVDLATGIYFVQVKAVDKVATFKLVKR